jgi:hypothetical protein
LIVRETIALRHILLEFDEVKSKIICIFFIVSLLAATSAQADGSYKLVVKRYMKSRLELLSDDLDKLDSGQSICGIGIQDSWNRTVVHVSDIGAANGLQPGDEIMAVNGDPIADESGSFEQVIRNFGANDKIAVNVMRNDEAIDLDAVCIDDTEGFRMQADMLRLAAKGKWKQCIAKSYDIDEMNGRKSMFSATFRNTCTEAKRCGWRCRKPTVEDAKSLYEVNLTELQAVTLANVDIDGVRTSVQNGIKWLEKTGYENFAADLKSRYKAADSAQSLPAAVISSTVGENATSGT